MISNLKFQISNSPKEPLWVLAPMANITTYPFASQCVNFGADLVWTPMVHTDVIINNLEEALKVLDFENHDGNCHSLLDTESKIPRLAGRQAASAPRAVSDGLGVESTGMTPKEAPKYIVQLVGSVPNDFEKAVKIIEKHLNPLGYDINMGCPDKNILKSGCGGSLLKDTNKIIEVVRSAKSSTNLPISVKTRAGYDNYEDIYVLVPKLIDVGVSMITIHPRTVKQGYAGIADWNIIKNIHSSFFKLQSSALLVGSGDIKTWQEAINRQKETNCDGIMIGRGALGKPWIFKEIKDKADYNPRVSEIKKLAFDLSAKTNAIWGEKGIVEARKHYSWYFKGFSGAKEIRTALMQASSLKEVGEILK